MNVKENWYVYKHLKPNSLDVFYIGIGKRKKYQKRYSSSYGRNIHWKRIVKKHGGFDSEIILDGLNQEDALELEAIIINQYGLKNLSNITPGGRGVVGKTVSEKTKLKMSKSHTGVPLKEHHVEAIRKSRVYGKNHYNARKVVDTGTGKIYDTVKEAAMLNNIKLTTLVARLTGQNKNETSLTYLNN